MIKHQIRYWRLENTTTRQAYYEVFLSDNVVVLRYGKLKTSGTKTLSEYISKEKAESTALAQVYAKQSKQYHPIHVDLVFESEFPLSEPHLPGVFLALRKAISSGSATPREQALNYIEGFIDDCNLFLDDARGQGVDEDAFERLLSRWSELEDKFDGAKIMIGMVKKRALRRV